MPRHTDLPASRPSVTDEASDAPAENAAAVNAAGAGTAGAGAAGTDAVGADADAAVLHALLLDGHGGARALSFDDIPHGELSSGVLWLHVDATHEGAPALLDARAGAGRPAGGAARERGHPSARGGRRRCRAARPSRGQPAPRRGPRGHGVAAIVGGDGAGGERSAAAPAVRRGRARVPGRGVRPAHRGRAPRRALGPSDLPSAGHRRHARRAGADPGGHERRRRARPRPPRSLRHPPDRHHPAPLPRAPARRARPPVQRPAVVARRGGADGPQGRARRPHAAHREPRRAARAGERRPRGARRSAGRADQPAHVPALAAVGDLPAAELPDRTARDQRRRHTGGGLGERLRRRERAAGGDRTAIVLVFRFGRWL